MQDSNQDFDLQLRSALEGAGIKPPKGAWKNISRRLDAADAVSGTRNFTPGIMRWAGVALACAAVAVGVFISIPDSAGPVTATRGVLTADAIELVVPEVGKASPLGSIGARNAKAAYAAPSSATELTDPAETEVPASPATNEDGSSRKAAAGTGRPDGGDSAMSDGSSADPFALLAMAEEKDGRRAGGTFLYAKGAIGGNDPDFVSRSAASMAPGVSSSGIRELTESTYGIPLTLGLGVRFYLLPRFSIGTGVDYSLLTRTFTGTYTEEGGQTEVSGDVQHTMHYIGVPLDLYYDILSSDKIKFYVYGGGEAEFCVSNKFTVFSTPQVSCSEPVRKIQYSVGGGVGVEFRLTDKLGLYLDPGVRYYFPGGQPKSIRTDKPLMFNFDAGLRFSL